MQTHVFFYKFHFLRTFFWKNVIEHLRVCAVHIHSIKASPQTYISVCIYETFNTQNIKENRAHRVTTKGLLYILIIHTNSVHFEDDTIKIGFFIKFIFYSHMSNSIPHRSLILPPGDHLLNIIRKNSKSMLLRLFQLFLTNGVWEEDI